MFGEGSEPGASLRMLDLTAGGVHHANQPRPLETNRGGLFLRENQSSGVGKLGKKPEDRFFVAESVKIYSKIQPEWAKPTVWGGLHKKQPRPPTTRRDRLFRRENQFSVWGKLG